MNAFTSSFGRGYSVLGKSAASDLRLDGFSNPGAFDLDRVGMEFGVRSAAGRVLEVPVSAGSDIAGVEFSLQAAGSLAAPTLQLDIIGQGPPTFPLGTTFTITANAGGTGAAFAVTADNLAAIGMDYSSVNWSKLQYGLAELFIEAQMNAVGTTGFGRDAALDRFSSLNTGVNIVDGMVAIDVVAKDGDGKALLAQLEALGLQRGAAFGALAGGLMPIDALDELANLDALNFARPVLAETHAGSVQSQNVTAMNVDYLHNSYGLTGAGVKIGFLSDSFDTATLTTSNAPLLIHYANDIASGDLPVGVQVLADAAGASVRDEGRAMIQLAYDIAPGASLAFHTAFVSAADFAQGILDLRDAGADIIVDDVRYFAEPFFQDGIIAQAVDNVVASGVMYFASAGNQGTVSYQSVYRPSDATADFGAAGIYRLHDFDPGAGQDFIQSITKTGTGTATFILNWDQPSASAGGLGSATDLAIIIFDSGGNVVAAVNSNNIGADAIEIAQGTSTAWAGFAIAVREGDAAPGLIKYSVSGAVTINQFATNSGTGFGHSNAAGAISVGASDWIDSGRYIAPYVAGEPMPYLESFSSRGDIPILFDTAGNRLTAAVYRSNVDFTASDGGNNTFFGSDVANSGAYAGFEADTSPNFYGTSAAAPNAAALAALLMQAFPTATNAQIETALKTSAIDVQVTWQGTQIGDGVDNRAGWGHVQADRAYLALKAILDADTVVSRGQAAIVSYETDSSAGGSPDGLRFVVLEDIVAGTTIYITDRAWNGTSFAAPGAGEGTYVYTPGAPVSAGTVVTLTAAQLTAAGITLSNGGETLYMYQGGQDTPTHFLFAADIADGNTTFNGSLVNTGLTAGQNAVAVQHDNANYHGPSTGIVQTQIVEISTNARWHGSDQDDIGGTLYTEVFDTNVQNVFTTPDMLLFGAMTGGGQSDAIIRVGNEEAANVGSHLARLMRDNPAFISMEDIAFDLEANTWFAVMNEGTDITRIVKGNISDLYNANQTASFTTVYEYNNDAANSGDDKFIQGIEIDKANDRIYFTLGDLVIGHNFMSVDYNGAGLRDWGPIDLVLDPTFGFAGGIEDFTLDLVHNTAYFTYVAVNAGAGQVLHNYIVKLNVALNVNPNPAVENYAIVNIANAGAPPAGYPAGRIPDSQGSVRGIDYDPDNNDLWFVTGRLGAGGTGGVFRLDLDTLNYTEMWEQPSNNAHNSPQAFPTTLLHDIEVDSIGDRYYLTDQSSTDTAAGHDGTATDENGGNIWTGSLTGAGAPTFFADIFEPTANGAVKGMEIDYAPTTSLVSANAGVTEASSAPASGQTALVSFITSGSTVADVDTTHLHGATVAITGNFQSGATHQDFLRFGGNLSGTISGITYSYNQATGVMTFTGIATLGIYESVLETVTFSTSGDDPTAFGNATNRTISVSVLDGLAWSDPQSVTVNVTGINDAPVNVVGATAVGNEDAGIAITGMSVSDVDADPANEEIVVTLSVDIGTVTIFTNVGGGIAAGDVTNNGTGTVTITATQNQINATFGAANGVTYNAPAHYNGAATLTIVTNDQGNNGNDPGNSGTGTTEADTDQKAITINAVNDAPVRGGTGTIDLATILEDTPSTTGILVSDIAGPIFSDPLDQQQTGGNPTGSVSDDLAGIAVFINNSGAQGTWQYHNGTNWVPIGAASASAAVLIRADAPIRFEPALNFNGAAPQLAFLLVDDSQGALTNGATADVSGVNGSGGTTRYSADGTILNQPITAVNDAPVNTVGLDLNINEDASATNVTGMAIADVDADPANDLVTVTLDVDHGTLAILTNVGGGIVAGDITAQDADTITITATINKINATLGAAGGLTYTPDANYNGGDTVEITTSDQGHSGQDPVPGTGTGTDEQDVDSKVINIAAVNDPISTAAPAAVSGDEDTSIPVAGLSISDLDSTLHPAGVYEVTLSAGLGTLTLTTVTGLTFTAGDGAGNTTMTFHGTLSDINTALATLSYLGAPNDEGADTISFSATDIFGVTVATGSGGATSDSDTINVTINSINDIPVLNVQDDTISGSEDGDIVFNAANSSLITVSDVDHATLTVTLTALHGVMTLSQTTGLTVTGNGSDTVELSGSAADINAALDGLIYRGDLNYEGSDTLNVKVDDGVDDVDHDIAITLADDGTIDGTTADDPASVLAGTALGDIFDLTQGGEDEAEGFGGNDGFYMGDALSAGDDLDGGAGSNDQLILQGNVTATILAGHLQNIEVISILSGQETRFGDTAGNLYDYSITMDDGAVDNGERLKIWAAGLVAGEDLFFDGSAESNGHFTIYAGMGTDYLIGGSGNDYFFFGDGRFTVADRIVGDGGAQDQLGLRGDYTTQLVFEDDTITGVDTIVLISSTDANYGPPGGSYGYNIKTHDLNLGLNEKLSVWGLNLTATETMTFDGSLETNGRFDLFGGAGADTLIGGAGNDMIFGGLRGDSLTGNGGNDTFVYRSTAESGGSFIDLIADFTSGDKIDLSVIDADTGTGGNQAFAFSTTGLNNAGDLIAIDNGAGSWTIQGDVDGDGNADLVINVQTGDLDPITMTDFIL